jgi:hypothetical protein
LDILFHWRRIVVVLGINLGKISRIVLFQEIFLCRPSCLRGEKEFFLGSSLSRPSYLRGGYPSAFESIFVKILRYVFSVAHSRYIVSNNINPDCTNVLFCCTYSRLKCFYIRSPIILLYHIRFYFCIIMPLVMYL